MADDSGSCGQALRQQETIEIDPLLFRKVMGSFASGVTVITTEVDGIRRGMTANAFMSGSLDPPLCVVSVAKRAHTHAMLVEAGRFGVSILAHDQEPYAKHFSGWPVAGLAVGFESVLGIPVLAGSVARMANEIIAKHDCGDHTIFIGRILSMEGSDRAPLIYYRGSFGALTHFVPEEEVPVPEFW